MTKYIEWYNIIIHRGRKLEKIHILWFKWIDEIQKLQYGKEIEV